MEFELVFRRYCCFVGNFEERGACRIVLGTCYRKFRLGVALWVERFGFLLDGL